MLYFRGALVFIKSPWTILRPIYTPKTTLEEYEMQPLTDQGSKSRNDIVRARSSRAKKKKPDRHYTCEAYKSAIDHAKCDEIWRDPWT